GKSSWALRFSDVVDQAVELLEEVVFHDSLRTLEEAGQMTHLAFASALFFEVGQTSQVDGKGGCQQAVATLPGELEGHLGAEKALEVDVVPGGLPVAHVGQVLDGDDRGGLVAENLRDHPVLGL